MVRGNILKTKVIISFSVQNLVIAPHFPQVNVQMPRPDLQGLGDLPLPIPPGALFLFHPSLNSSHLGLSVAQMSRAPYYLRDFLLALFSPATPSSSLTNSYLSFRSQLRWYFLQDASLTPWWDLTSFFHALSHLRYLPFISHAPTRLSASWLLSQLDYKIPRRLDLSLSNWLLYFQCLAELSTGYLINTCWINTWLPMQTEPLPLDKYFN